MKKTFSYLSMVLAIWLGTFLTSCSDSEPDVTDIMVNEDIICRTGLMVTNQSNDTVQVYLTLGCIGDKRYVQSTKGIFGIKTAGSQGSFILKPGESREYIDKKQALSGNFAFGTPPLNCPTGVYKKGINLFEFCLNNDFGKDPQETIDISCVAGVNAYLQVNVSDDDWVADTVVTEFANDTLYGNMNRRGVLPYGCDVCTSSSNPPSCPNHLPYSECSEDARCLVQRPSNKKGGSVSVIFKGFTK